MLNNPDNNSESELQNIFSKNFILPNTEFLVPIISLIYDGAKNHQNLPTQVIFRSLLKSLMNNRHCVTRRNVSKVYALKIFQSIHFICKLPQSASIREIKEIFLDTTQLMEDFAQVGLLFPSRILLSSDLGIFKSFINFIEALSTNSHLESSLKLIIVQCISVFQAFFHIQLGIFLYDATFEIKRCSSSEEEEKFTNTLIFIKENVQLLSKIKAIKENFVQMIKESSDNQSTDKEIEDLVLIRLSKDVINLLNLIDLDILMKRLEQLQTGSLDESNTVANQLIEKMSESFEYRSVLLFSLNLQYSHYCVKKVLVFLSNIQDVENFKFQDLRKLFAKDDKINNQLLLSLIKKNDMNEGTKNNLIELLRSYYIALYT